MREYISKDFFDKLAAYNETEKFVNENKNCEILVCPFTNDIVAMHLSFGDIDKYILLDKDWTWLK